LLSPFVHGSSALILHLAPRLLEPTISAITMFQLTGIPPPYPCRSPSCPLSFFVFMLPFLLVYDYPHRRLFPFLHFGDSCDVPVPSHRLFSVSNFITLDKNFVAVHDVFASPFPHHMITQGLVSILSNVYLSIFGELEQMGHLGSSPPRYQHNREWVIV